MGTYRCYICPEGVIDIQDLPHGWGLLWVNKRGHVKLKAGHVCCYKVCAYGQGRDMARFWQHSADLRFELDMMAHALVRFGDPEEAKALVRNANREYSRVAAEVNKLREEIKQYRLDSYRLKLYEQQYGELCNG